ncbi:MAG: YbjQ family protein [Oligoflexia bacterium]|nr:YbjQ family protein [Oligoflexia bacterium]
MILTTIDQVPGRQIQEHYGLVSGSTVRSKNVFRDFFAGLKDIVGGELKGYTELLEETRSEALERLVTQAESKGANAVINIRFATSDVAPGAAEVFVYGTAVRVI